MHSHSLDQPAQWINSHRDICPCNICPGDICPYQKYLNCYWPDFDETLKVGSWEDLKQIPTVRLTFIQATFVHVGNISAVTDPILTKLLGIQHFLGNHKPTKLNSKTFQAEHLRPKSCLLLLWPAVYQYCDLLFIKLWPAVYLYFNQVFNHILTCCLSIFWPGIYQYCDLLFNIQWQWMPVIKQCVMDD